MGKTLFIGNGVNRLTNATSWKQVLDSLAKFAVEHEQKDEPIIRDIDRKPFTLVFEEIFLRSARAHHKTELELKKEAARLISDIPKNGYHSRIMELKAKHTLTTNYDYNLENGSGVERRDTSTRQEQKYSLFRRCQVGSQWVWHIHGEASVPASLALGHDHYAGSLHHIRDYLVTRVRGQVSPFLDDVPNFDIGTTEYSWLDIFLRDDIHIYGFSLDYTEIELWWLLSFKERERFKPEARHFGQTYFYYFDNGRPDPVALVKKAILESFGVRVVQLKGDDHADAFDDFIDRFNSTPAQI